MFCQHCTPELNWPSTYLWCLLTPKSNYEYLLFLTCFFIIAFKFCNGFILIIGCQLIKRFTHLLPKRAKLLPSCAIISANCRTSVFLTGIKRHSLSMINFYLEVFSVFFFYCADIFCYLVIARDVDLEIILRQCTVFKLNKLAFAKAKFMRYFWLIFLDAIIKNLFDLTWIYRYYVEVFLLLNDCQCWKKVGDYIIYCIVYTYYILSFIEKRIKIFETFQFLIFLAMTFRNMLLLNSSLLHLKFVIIFST